MRNSFSRIFKFLSIALVVLIGCGEKTVPDDFKIPSLPSVRAVVEGGAVTLTAEFKSEDEAAAVKDCGFYFGADATALQRVTCLT